MRLFCHLPISVPFRNVHDSQVVCWSCSLLPSVAGSCFCWWLLFPTEKHFSDTISFFIFLHFMVSDMNLSHSGRNMKIRSELLYVITMYDDVSEI